MTAKEMTVEDLKSMPLHHREYLGYDTFVLRVVGGWIYEVEGPEYENSKTNAIAFVPEPSNRG